MAIIEASRIFKNVFQIHNLDPSYELSEVLFYGQNTGLGKTILIVFNLFNMEITILPHEGTLRFQTD